MTEADLILSAKQGNQKAFTEIFESYRIPVYFFILRRIHNETDTENLLMETFERAFAGINHFVPLVKLRTWLTEIAKNRITDYYREKKRIPQMTEPDYTVRDNHTPDRICIYNQEFGMIQEGIRAFKSDKHRKIMILYCQGWKMKDIALELQMPMGTVQNYIHRNKIKLRRLVA